MDYHYLKEKNLKGLAGSGVYSWIFPPTYTKPPGNT
jgi:hypothetical protein